MPVETRTLLHSGALLFGILCASACSSKVPAPCQCAPAVCPSAPDAGGAPKDASFAPAAEPPESLRTTLARYFPGADDARSARHRQPNVVILFAPPSAQLEPGTLAAVEKVRLQPVVCVLSGKLAFGARCGEAMPARTKVRITDAGSSGDEELTVERATAPFHDAQGQQVYPAPYAPACCMYNTCVGRTLPYFPKVDAQVAMFTTKTLLAVWPADAEIELTTFQPGVADDVSLDKAPWTPLPCKNPAECLVQAAQIGSRRYASIKNSSIDAKLLADLGQGWQPFTSPPGPREFYLLSATDLNRDGKPELLVYARYANDYGLQVYADDDATPRYGFSCGNI